MDMHAELKRANDYIFELEHKINNLVIETKNWERKYQELYKDFQNVAKLYKESTEDNTGE
jgi:molecular chaperone GrpE (heat shock protein)